MRYVWLAGLLVAIGSAVGMAVLPPEEFLFTGLVTLLLGLLLFTVGFFLRLRQQKKEIDAAMRRFAEQNSAMFEESFPVDQLSDSISLFQLGVRQRCTNAIALQCANRACRLFRFEYYHRGRPGDAGAWYDHYVAYISQAFPKTEDFDIRRRFSLPGPLISVIAAAVLVAVASIGGYAVAESASAIRNGLLYSAATLLIGTAIVCYARMRSKPDAAPDFLDQQGREFFRRRGYRAECRDGSLAVWNDRSIERLWRTGWNRSFRPVEDWIEEELHGLLDAARLVLSNEASGQNGKPDSADAAARTGGSL